MSDSDTLMTDGTTNTDAGQTQNADTTANANDQQQTEGNPNPEAQATEGQTEGAKGEKEGEGKQGAPEAYEDFTFSEGVKVDAEAVETFKTLAKEHNLSQADAQKFADLGGKLSQQWETKLQDSMKAARTEWVNQAKTDKEFGGDKLNENLAVAKKGLDTFGTPELRQLLNESGFGDHPEVIRVFHRIGKAISEDSKLVTGNIPTAGKTPDQILYPNQSKAQ